MSRKKKLLSGFIILSLVGALLMPAPRVSADSGVVDSLEIVHEHSVEGGSCYEAVLHTHTGDATNGGGCYTVEVAHTHVSKCYTTKGYSDNGNSTNWCGTCGGSYTDHSLKCSICGDTSSSRTSYCTCGAHPGKDPSSHSHKVLKCSKTIDGYDLGCLKQEGDVDSYNLICGRTDLVDGKVELVKSRAGDDYTLSVVLTENYEGCNLSVFGWRYNNSYVSGSTGTSFEVTENGHYCVTVEIHSVRGYFYEDLCYDVTDFDNQPPVISHVDKTETRAKFTSVSVNATDNFGVVGYMLKEAE